MTPPVYIVDAVRTPIGRFRGSLAGVRADDLGAAVLLGLQRRNGLNPLTVDDVIFGCVTQIGEQSANIARTALLSAGWPEAIPGLTIDRKCGSSEAAVHVGAGLIASGAADVVVAGGAENMSRVPMGSNRDLHGEAFGRRVTDRFEMTSQGEAAERIADLWSLSREMLDAYALTSHERALAAVSRGDFAQEIEPVSLSQWLDAPAENERVFDADETPRTDTSAARLATLKTSFRPAGRITAGNSSQISDGAAALLLMSEKAVRQSGLRPRARIVGALTVGADPTLMLTGPITATLKILARHDLAVADIELFEVNEAFASVPLAWLKETGASADRLNVNGGAIALGHPLGASGARIMTSLLGELERRKARYGLQTICCSGGMATSTIIERL